VAQAEQAPTISVLELIADFFFRAPMSHRPNNPYYNTSSIDDPNLFFNREEIVETIMNSLFSEVPQCISIVGQRKIGKSSLVRHISRPSTVRNFQFDPDNVIFVYFDCQKRGHALRSGSRFYQELLDCLREVLPSEDIRESTFSNETESRVTGKALERSLRILHEAGFTVIILFDEFDKAISQQALVTEGFFGSLRGYTQANRNLGWITCTSRPLHQLFEEAFDEFGVSRVQRRSESDFFNIAPPITVRLFEIREVDVLISEPAQAQGVKFSEADKAAIRELAGNFPYFVQRCCYHLFNQYLHGLVSLEALRERTLTESMPLWEDYWQKLSAGQKRTLVDVASGAQELLPTKEVEVLRDASLIYQNENGLLVTFCEAFGTFVRDRLDEINSAPFPDANDLLARVKNLERELQEEREKTTTVAKSLVEEQAATVVREGTITDLLGSLTRRSFLIRLLIALLVAVVGFGGIFLIPKIWQWHWLMQHPKKKGIYICASLIVIGLSWIIVDRKRRLIVLLSVVVAAILVFVQIS
jgi:AAA-like domain